MRIGTLCFAAAVALGPAARAADTFEVDSVHSTVLFRVKHMGTSYAYGRFNEISGRFALDDADPARSRVEVGVKSGSVDTGNAKRDQHLRGVDFFNAGQYPDLTFKSTKVARSSAGPDAFDVTGDMTFHGVTRPVTVRLERTGTGRDMSLKPIAGFEGTFAVKRSDFGMKGMVGPVGDDVRVTVSVEGVRK